MARPEWASAIRQPILHGFSWGDACGDFTPAPVTPTQAPLRPPGRSGQAGSPRSPRRCSGSSGTPSPRRRESQELTGRRNHLDPQGDPTGTPLKRGRPHRPAGGGLDYPHADPSISRSIRISARTAGEPAQSSPVRLHSMMRSFHDVILHPAMPTKNEDLRAFRGSGGSRPPGACGYPALHRLAKPPAHVGMTFGSS